ncbi:MAG: ABC transporter ATP-binding protein [Clostridiales bacterium]|jgi:iron complex transport system ATP-binding protein|nr:ABC transporter ATP-binding protein [Clostridiales bacterium]
MIKAENISYSFGQNKILENVSMTANPGEVTVIAGSNGTGKSTLLKNICGILQGSGEVYICGKNRDQYTRKELSKKISYLSQFHNIDADINVFEIVLLGRVNSLNYHVPQEEVERVWSTLKFLNIEQFANRKMTQLSGGQAQMVFIGQALIREPEILILDEPTNNLDMRYTFKILDLIQRLTREKKFTTVMVLHDQNLLERFSDKLIIINDGKIYDQGHPKDVLNHQMFKDVYHMNVKFYETDEGFSTIVPISPYK